MHHVYWCWPGLCCGFGEGLKENKKGAYTPFFNSLSL